MVRMFVRHPVTDFATWKQAYDAFDGARAGMGVTGHAVYQATSDPNDVTVYHEFQSMDDAKAFASSDRLREVMKGGGVQGEPVVWFTNKS